MHSWPSLETRRLYRHLHYRWQIFGIGFEHLAIAALPAMAYLLLAAAASPAILGVSVKAAAFIGVAGAAVLHSFAPMVAPSAPPLAVAAGGMAPGLLLLALCLLPEAVRDSIPMWPAVPALAFGLVAVVVLQWRRDAQALWVHAAWQVAPRRLSASVEPALPKRRPFPVDRSFGARASGAAP